MGEKSTARTRLCRGRLKCLMGSCKTLRFLFLRQVNGIFELQVEKDCILAHRCKVLRRKQKYGIGTCPSNITFASLKAQSLVVYSLFIPFRV